MYNFFFFYNFVEEILCLKSLGGGKDIIARNDFSDIRFSHVKTVSKFASSETLEYNRKEDIVEIFLLRMGGWTRSICGEYNSEL